MTDMTNPAPIPLSRPQAVDAIPPAGGTCVFEATEAERTALAKFIGILDVHHVSANLKAEREGTRVRVTGTVNARVSQACVVTLEPVEESIAEDVEQVFAPKEEADAAYAAAGLPDEADLDEIDPADIDLSAIDLATLDDPDALPDPIVEGRIDFGHVAYEALVLALDPYPRKPDARFEAADEPEGFGSPFGALAALKTRN